MDMTMDGWVYGYDNVCMGVWMNGCMDAWVYGYDNGRMDV